MEKRFVSQAEFAKRMNVTSTAISSAIQHGRVKTQKRLGQVVIDSMIEGPKFNATRGPLSKPGAVEVEPVPFPVPRRPLALASVPLAKATTRELTVVEAREQQERYKAMKAKMEYEREAGLVVEVKEVEREWTTIAIALRKAVMNIADRLAPLVAAEDDARRCWAILDEECRAILEDVSDAMSRGKTTGSENGDGEGVETSEAIDGDGVE